MKIQTHAKQRYDSNISTRGHINLETDPRDWAQETLEELADAWNYLDYLAKVKGKKTFKITVYAQVLISHIYDLIKNLRIK